MLRAGTKAGRYEILEKIGQGGMGEVYRARDAALHRDVAVKVLAAHVAADRDRMRRFDQEARAVSALNHPNIVHVYDIGDAEQDGATFRFIAMELVEGETLRRAMVRGVEPRVLLAALAQVADALSRAHAAGIVHRDLKPENILLATGGYAKVLDFGLAKPFARAVSPDASVDELTDRMSTATGIVLGTPGYMAPEQIEDAQVDHRADVFALGCILYEAVADEHPFRGATALDTMHNVVHAAPAPLAGDPELERVIRRCLAKKPADRYQSMTEVADELRALAPPSRPVVAQHPRRRSRWPIAIALVALVGIAAAIVFWQRKQAGEWSSVAPTERTTNLELLSKPDGVHHGEKISFSLQNAEIVDVLRTFAIVTGLNITAAPNVEGSVTAHFENVPWDEAFRVFLDQNDLRYEVRNEVVIVSRK